MKLAVVLFLLVAAASSTPVKKRDFHGKRVYLKALTVEQALSAHHGNHSAIPQGATAIPLMEVEATPEIMPLEMHTEEEGRIHGLLLQRNFRIEHPVTISYNDGVTEEEYAPLNADGHAQYHDNSGSIFGVRNIGGNKKFDGSFHVDGLRYEVHPMEEDDGVRARGFEDHHPHLITKATALKFSTPLRMAESENVKVTKTTEKRGSSYHIEFAIIVDYSEFLRWKNELGSQSAATDALKYKFSYTYNGMDSVYKSVNHNGMTITIWLKKLEIQTSMNNNLVQAVYSNINPSDARTAILDANALLQREYQWAPGQGFAVPSNYDHVMYWIGYQMQGATIGLAYLGAVCDRQGYSIIEDNGFESWRTAAHELGHSLGADHDEGSGDCAASKMHIMAPMEGLPNEDNNMDGYTFSTCSLNDMAKTLGSGKASCVSNRGSNNFGQVSVNPLPGQKFSADWQCQWTYVEVIGTSACNSPLLPEECYDGLWCDKLDRTCNVAGALRPADGTPCQGGQCIHGKCQ